ncbi:MAG TPA: hypothetical protein VFK30_08565, partial [Anaerolineae bacterium]|nr:hypothetical protein [Anaerolineae bacterium]
MRASIVTFFIIISAYLLISCRAPTATPTATATSIPDTASATLPPITTLTIASVTPASTIEPTTTPAPSPQPIEVTFSPSASPRPKITSTPQPITITLFAIEPATIDPGDAITITWQTTGGQVNLIPINPLGQMSAPIPVANTGSKVITTDKSQRNFMLFMLNVHDARLNKDLQAFASVT